ncbi:MAG: protein kinase, partial [Xenococcaceae cyanobacterium MO_167.B27]|nr:protein kinase [Xenococcaceae cyanobacterium MO_167.B27]
MANAPYLALGDNTDQPKEIIQDKYRIRGILGKGSVGITYSAVNLQTESSVAIKVICLKQLKDWKQIELFKREAEVLSKLNHPAIPKYIDYFDIETETDKAFYIVQQQAPGKSLAQLVESGWRTTEAEVKNIAQQLLSILIYLHSLKP